MFLSFLYSKICSIIFLFFLRAKNFTNSMCVTGMNGLFFFYISLIALICFQIIISFLGCWAAIRLVHFDSEDIERQGLINKDKNPEMQISSVLY